MAEAINLSNSNIPIRFSEVIGSSGTQNVGEEFVPFIFEGIIMGFADAAKNLRDKNATVAVILRDRPLDGDFLFGIKIKFTPGSDDESGSWNTVWSFNKEDFEDCDIKHYVDEPNTMPSFRDRLIMAGLKLYPMSDLPYLLAKTAFQTLFEWLDTNAKDGETVTVVKDGLFEARVDVDNGIKIMNLIPSEEVTNLAKSDGDI